MTNQTPKDDPLFTPIQIGDARVPGAWRYLLPEDGLWLRLPGERWSSCDDCYRAALGDCRDDVRCCTYLPPLPNFMLGLALMNPVRSAPCSKGGPGTAEVVGQIIDRGQTLPQGLAPTPEQFRAAVETNAADLFGHDTALVCPFMRGSDHGCAIHAFRNSICATYFCEHDHGEEGEAYWDALQALVGLVETVVAQWAMTEVGLDSDDYYTRLDATSDKIAELSAPEGWSRQAREVLWGEWFGRERAFFEACAQQVMDHRDELFAIACATPLREARAYERAVHAWIPAGLRDELPPLSVGEPVPIEALWYSLQLKTRQLWELPFNEGAVVLAPGAVVATNPRDDRASQLRSGWSSMITTGDDKRLYLTADEARALELFSAPQILGEALFARPEIKALDDARRLLAECLRRGLLVLRGD